MRRTEASPPEEGHDGRARVSRLLTGDPAARVLLLRRVVAAALIAGGALSHNLWFPTSRTFPRAPFIPRLPSPLIPALEYLTGGLLVFSLASLALARGSTKYLYAALASLALLVSSDQTRLQPWVYQYLLILFVIALYQRPDSDERSVGQCLPILQVVVAMFYFWGGVQKLNYSFCHEVVPQLLTPLRNFATLTETQTSALGVGMASVEIFVGCGLLLRRTRNLCVGLALAMHAMLLVLLIAKSLNSVIWAWNAALMLAVPSLFWRSDASARQAFADWLRGSARVRAALSVVVLCAVLPALSFRGWWDMYLSGALYSGNTTVAVVRVGEQVYERLPPTAKRQVFTTRNGERMLPLYEWSMAELNVPTYPEPRVFRQVARELCQLTDDKSQAELIMRGRTAPLDGSYVVSRIDCVQLDE
ncbi:MAG: hypothetical protein QOC99_3710 [Acidobacteriota bacterium]|nr:hypothetical protein [Acidobacteriota bacterium]